MQTVTSNWWQNPEPDPEPRGGNCRIRIQLRQVRVWNTGFYYCTFIQLYKFFIRLDVNTPFVGLFLLRGLECRSLVLQSYISASVVDLWHFIMDAGSANTYHWRRDSDPVPAFSVSGGLMITKNKIFCFFLFEVTFTSVVFLDKKSKRSHKIVETRFFSFFLLVGGRIRMRKK